MVLVVSDDEDEDDGMDGDRDGDEDGSSALEDNDERDDDTEDEFSGGRDAIRAHVTRRAGKLGWVLYERLAEAGEVPGLSRTSPLFRDFLRSMVEEFLERLSSSNPGGPVPARLRRFVNALPAPSPALIKGMKSAKQGVHRYGSPLEMLMVGLVLDMHCAFLRKHDGPLFIGLRTRVFPVLRAYRKVQIGPVSADVAEKCSRLVASVKANFRANAREVFRPTLDLYSTLKYVHCRPQEADDLVDLVGGTTVNDFVR